MRTIYGGHTPVQYLPQTEERSGQTRQTPTQPDGYEAYLVIKEKRSNLYRRLADA